MGYRVQKVLTGKASLADSRPSAPYAALSVALLFLKLLQLDHKNGDNTCLWRVYLHTLFNAVEGKDIVICGHFSAFALQYPNYMEKSFRISPCYAEIIPHNHC